MALAPSERQCAADVVAIRAGRARFPHRGAWKCRRGKTIPIFPERIIGHVIFHSGTTPAPLDPKAEAGSAAYWGDTKTQALSAFARIKESLDDMKLGFGNVVAMTVYLVGDPAKGGRMDFEGFMAAYTQFFGTKEQPNLPARSTVQVAGLVAPGMLVEIEVQLVK